MEYCATFSPYVIACLAALLSLLVTRSAAEAAIVKFSVSTVSDCFTYTATMFSRFATPLAGLNRAFSTSRNANAKVAVMGASGGEIYPVKCIVVHFANHLV